MSKEDTIINPQYAYRNNPGFFSFGDFYYIILTADLCGAYTMPDTIFNTFTCVNSQQLYAVGTLIISILQMMIQAEKG